MQQQQCASLKTVKVLLQLHCRRCSATLRSLSHFFLLLPSFGQLLWPVCNFVHFVLRSAPLHPFVPRHFASGHGIPPPAQGATPGGMHMPFIKSTLRYSLGSIMLHYVLHSLQSHPVHPLPSVVVLALRPPPALRGSVGTDPPS